MLDLAILGLLGDGELHGYEIRRQLREHLGLLANVSFGSIYPALARLESAGAVEAVAGSGGGGAVAPPTGSLSGELAVFRARRHPRSPGRRSRKAYRITPEGRRLFAELLSGGGADDARSFGLRLAFARHLAPQARVALLERRRAVLVQRLDEIRAARQDPGLDVYARSVVEHTAEGVEGDIGWLDRLLEAERVDVARVDVERVDLARTAASPAPPPAPGRSAVPPAPPGALGPAVHGSGSRSGSGSADLVGADRLGIDLMEPPGTEPAGREQGDNR